MIQAILIPSDESVPASVIDVAGLKDMQKAVGGLIEAVDLESINATFYVNENGKLEYQPINRRATLLWWCTLPITVHSDAIVGDALLVGQPDSDGDTMSVPEELVKLLFATASYKAEFQTIDDPDRFNGNMRRFDDYFEAANHALAKAQVWMAVERVRVVPAEG